MTFLIKSFLSSWPHVPCVLIILQISIQLSSSTTVTPRSLLAKLHTRSSELNLQDYLSHTLISYSSTRVANMKSFTTLAVFAASALVASAWNETSAVGTGTTTTAATTITSTYTSLCTTDSTTEILTFTTTFCPPETLSTITYPAGPTGTGSGSSPSGGSGGSFPGNGTSGVAGSTGAPTKTPVGPSSTTPGSSQFTGAAVANNANAFSGLAAVGLAIAYFL